MMSPLPLSTPTHKLPPLPAASEPPLAAMSKQVPPHTGGLAPSPERVGPRARPPCSSTGGLNWAGRHALDASAVRNLFSLMRGTRSSGFARGRSRATKKEGSGCSILLLRRLETLVGGGRSLFLCSFRPEWTCRLPESPVRVLGFRKPFAPCARRWSLQRQKMSRTARVREHADASARVCVWRWR